MKPTPTSQTARPASAASYAPQSRLAVGPLLVATAGGAAAPVFTAARVLAGRLGATPGIVAVNEPFALYMPGISMEALPAGLPAEQRARLRQDVMLALTSSYDGDASWPVEIVDGQPARAIAHVAQERGARMIVMGIGRHAPMDRIFGSETALQVIRLSDRPVLAVAPTFSGLPRHAVVAVDFSPASVRAVEEALAMLAEGGRLSLVHVRSSLDLLGRLDPETLSTIYNEGIARLFDRLVAALHAPAAVTIERVVLTGDPSDELLRYCERHEAELVAVGSSGLGFFDRLMVGSVATRILRRATVSVLAVPRPSAAEVERIERQLSGDVTTSEVARWPALVEAFSERNAGRPTQLEIDDPELGAQFQETGYTLLGASYDRRDDRLEIMLGAPTGGGHLTHTVGKVTSIAVLTDSKQHDLALQARHGQGQTILLFRDRAPADA